MSQTTRRTFLGAAAAGLTGPALARTRADEPPREQPVTIRDGDLKTLFRDNAESPAVLSGVDSLFNERDAADFDAFDPDTPGGSAGLNFEHIISGHENRHNAFTPRSGKFAMTVLTDARSIELVRRRDDDPWSMASRMKYTLVPPCYIDVDFRCTLHDPSLFGRRGSAILFFANYMNDVEDVALHFRGIPAADEAEQWIRADAPPGHPHWNQGGTYRHADAVALEYDADQQFVLNSWSYDYPRFAQPFYYGRAAHGMTLMIMFDKTWSPEEEIRFSLFKFKILKFPRPAWDFQ